MVSENIEAGRGASFDFEQVLPYVVQRFVPTVLKGILIAGLLAAALVAGCASRPIWAAIRRVSSGDSDITRHVVGGVISGFLGKSQTADIPVCCAGR